MAANILLFQPLDATNIRYRGPFRCNEESSILTSCLLKEISINNDENVLV